MLLMCAVHSFGISAVIRLQYFSGQTPGVTEICELDVVFVIHEKVGRLMSRCKNGGEEL